MSLLITNIQRMCFHDGPGIRTTVFLKGCSLHCPWCANPENISAAMQEGRTADGLRVQYGRTYEEDELIGEIEKDRVFWGKEGGVTFSGGEPLLQSAGLAAVLQRLKQRKTHIAVETALFVPEKNLADVLDFIDFLYVDIKILQPEVCRRVLGGDIELYLKNINFLMDQKKEVCFRIPCSKEYTMDEGNRDSIVELLMEYPGVPVQIFAVHGLAESKYKSLGLSFDEPQKVPETELELLRTMIEEKGHSVEIIHI